MTSSLLQRSQLHHYQTEMVDRVKSIPSAGLFMEMGLGKTVTALTIIAEQFKGKTLVVAPLKIAENVWEQEIANWEHLQKLKLSKVLGTPSQRLVALKQSSDIYVVNLENLVWLLETGMKFNNLVIDESSKFKDPSTKRFKALKKQLRMFDRKLILTGTPSPQSVGDLWSQCGILDLGARLETSLTKFRDKYMEPDGMNRHTRVVYSWKPKPQAVETIQSKISDICFSLKAEDYLTMPACQTISHQLDMTKKERHDYDSLKKEAVLELKDTTLTAASAATLSQLLCQFVSGACYKAEEEGYTEVNDIKLQFLSEILDARDTPTIVFYHYRHSLDRLQKILPDAKTFSPENLAAWKAGEFPILLLQPISSGIGLNGQNNSGKTANIIWFDNTFSAEVYAQANARVFRQGQTSPVIIHHLTIKDTIDQHVLNILEGKLSLQEALMDHLKLK